MSTAQTITIVISLAVVALALVGLGYWNWKMIIEAEKNTIASADKGHGTLNKHLDEIKGGSSGLEKGSGAGRPSTVQDRRLDRGPLWR